MIAIHYNVHASHWLTANKWPFSPHIASILYFMSTLLYVFLFQHVCSCNYILKYYILYRAYQTNRLQNLLSSNKYFTLVNNICVASKKLHNYIQYSKTFLICKLYLIKTKIIGSYATALEEIGITFITNIFNVMLLKMW